MERRHPLEPNPSPGRPLTSQFIGDLVRFLEGTAALARGPGLVAPCAGERVVLPYLDPPDVLNLRAIRAIGECGYAIIAGHSGSCSLIQPYDTARLPLGRHRIYACASHEKVATGQIVEEPAGGNGAGTLRSRSHRVQRVVLEADDGRFEHLDWLPVAEIDRVHDAGMPRTLLDGTFHPQVQDMRAWALPNATGQLASQMLDRLEDGATGPFDASLRLELVLLRNLVETGRPDAVMLQAQRCLGLLRLDGSRLLPLDGRLERYRIEPDSFSSFMADLSATLSRLENPETFPTLLEIDGERYVRIAGGLVEDGDTWVWSLPGSEFVANGLAIYLPRALRESLPQVRYGPHRTSLDTVSRTARQLAGPGTALLLEGVRGGVPALHLTVDTESRRQRLRQLMGDGHALYKC